MAGLFETIKNYFTGGGIMHRAAIETGAQVRQNLSNLPEATAATGVKMRGDVPNLPLESAKIGAAAREKMQGSLSPNLSQQAVEAGAAAREVISGDKAGTPLARPAKTDASLKR